MPSDWLERAVEYHGEECPGVIAVLPEENDVALAKVAAWRQKDQQWLIEAVKSGVISPARMFDRVDRMPKPNAEGNPPPREVLLERLRLLATRAGVDLPEA
jgi:hypothetical protein